MNKILRYISVIIVTITFILASYILIFGSIARKNNELLTFFGYSYSVVPTNSMDGNYPDSFKEDSVIITKKVRYENLEIEDIIVFKDLDKNILIVHRIIEIDDSGNYITKGDNPNTTIDINPVTKDLYQAKVIKSFKLPLFLSDVSSLQIMILFVLIIVLTTFAIYQILVIIKTINENKLKRIKEENEAIMRKEILEKLKKESDD